MNTNKFTKPVRFLEKNGELFLAPPKKTNVVTGFNLQDLNGSNELIESLKSLKNSSQPLKALQLLLLYKSIYNLSDEDVKRYAQLAGLSKPVNMYKLQLLKKGVCSKTFPTFRQLYPDITDLSKDNWVKFKIDTLRTYLLQSIQSSEPQKYRLHKKCRNFEDLVKSLIDENSFSKEEFTPFMYFNCGNTVAVIKENDCIQLKINEISNKTEIIRDSSISNTNNNIELGKVVSNIKINTSDYIELSGKYPIFIKYVDYSLNECLKKYLATINLRYLDEVVEKDVS